MSFTLLKKTMTKDNLETISSLGSLVSEDDIVRRYVRPNDAAKMYGIGRQYLENVAADAGALYKIGRVVLINVDAFEAYLQQFKVK